MSPRRRSGRRILKALLPIILLLAVSLVGVVGWIVYGVTHPPKRPFLVTPEKFTNISARGLKATDETWLNRDGTRARGWLLRGGEGAPAVVLLHRYGADRSWLLNLGVKLNETTNYTVLWPDLRGHGEQADVKWTAFGMREGDDIAAAVDYLRSLKTGQNRPLVSEAVGIYGIELGAYAALRAAAREPAARALVLDSVPGSPDDVLGVAVKERVGFDNRWLQLLVRAGIELYFLGQYDNLSSCSAAASIGDRRVLLLAGVDASRLKDSTVNLSQCFPGSTQVELVSNLPLTGFNLPFVTSQQDETYDRRVIDFFDRSLRERTARLR